MRIVMIAPYYYPQYGGAENQARLLSRWLSCIDSMEVTVLTLHLFGGDAEEHLDGHRVLRFGDTSRKDVVATGLMGIKAWLANERGSYDLVHQHFIYGQSPITQLEIGDL